MPQPQNRTSFGALPVTSPDQKLDIVLQVEMPGRRVDLNSYPYQLTDDTLTDVAVQWRRQEIQSPFVAGSFLVNALQENSTVTVGVYVRGDSHSDLDANLDRLVEAFSQFSYRMYWAIGDWDYFEVWTCMPADYTVQTTREYRHARMAVMRAEVPRMPVTELVER
jgi:hypothetical protein